MSSFPLLECLDPSCWSFLAEGFDSIIFSYVGPPHPTYTNHVLRLFKVQNEGYRRGGAIPPLDFTPYVLLHQRFLASFIRPYLPAIDGGVPLSVPTSFVEQIDDLCQSKRSARRIQESKLCRTSTVAILHLNHLLPESLVIEIKPKWGFLPDCPLISNPVKFSVSRFQLMQRLKLKKGEINSFTEYDPPDLFSRTTSGVTKAINALLTNPQGNLKIFRNCKTSTLDPSEKNGLIEHFLNPSDALFATMGQILSLQRLDFWDIENIEPILQKAGNPLWDDLVTDEVVIEGIRKLITEGYQLPQDINEVKEILEQMDQITARIHLTGFLISQSAKDCSIMIVFPKSIADSPDSFVIDFDLKKPELLLSNYLKADRRIIEAYLEWKALQ